jgi:pyruvate/2-oxoglutarate dehydrogenase complex dihydrolipoamide dehydrogenase (E3) component
MAKYDFDIGIIGGGSAGLTVAAGAAQLGARTLLVEKEPVLGGDCLHYGCVPSKTLIRTAQVYQTMKKAPDFGLPRVETPPVDFSAVKRRIQEVIGAIQKHDSEERFCRLGAKVEFGQPAFVDERSIQLNGRTWSARNWVLATGSSPDRPRVPGLEHTPHLTNKELFSLERLPESMIILGAGPIAIEMAQAFNRLGTNVSVIQRSGQILSKEDQDLADEVMAVLKAEGVAFYLNTAVVGTRDLGNRREVAVKNQEGREIKLTAEEILVALGRTSNLDGLNLKQIGVDYDGRGLKVDQRLRTTQKHIYGAGDVTGAYQFTHAAGYEGGIVVANAIFHLPRKADYTFLPWCTYTDPELAGIGLNEKAAQEAGIKYSVWTEAFENNDRSLAEGERVGRIKMILDAKEKPIGVQILGPQAGELLNEWVAVLNGKVRLSTLAGAVHPYPTLGEINKRVVGAFFSGKIYSDIVKAGLKLFFSLKGRACEVPPQQ